MRPLDSASTTENRDHSSIGPPMTLDHAIDRHVGAVDGFTAVLGDVAA